MAWFQTWIYSIKQFFRSPKRSFSIMIGIILSVTLVSGIFIAGNGLMGYSIKNGLSDVSIDWTLQVNPDVEKTTVLQAFDTVKQSNDPLTVMDQIFPTSTRVFMKDPIDRTGVPDSVRLQKGLAFQTNSTIPVQNSSLDQVSLIGAESTFLTKDLMEEIFDFSTNLSAINHDSGIFVDTQTALWYNISVGDTISLHAFWENANYSSHNIIVKGIFEVLDLRTLFTAFFPDNYYIPSDQNQGRQRITNNLLINYLQRASVSKHFIIGELSFIRTLISQLSSNTPESYEEDIGYRYDVLLNHDNLPILDEGELESYLSQLKNRFIIEIGSNNLEIEDNLVNLIGDVQNQFTIFETLSLVVSIPTIMLGIFLTDTIYKLSLEQRKREFGLIKSRGGTSRQNFSIFLQEATFISSIAGCIGAICGFGVAYGIAAYILGDAYQDFLMVQPIQINWIIFPIVIISASIVTLLSVRKPIRKFAHQTVVQTTSHYTSEENQKPPKGKFDIIALIFGVFPIALIYLEEIIPTFSGLLQIFINLINALGTAFTWISPFLLTYALVKIIAARSIQRLGLLSEKIAGIFMGEKGSLISKNIIRNPRRATRLIFIISVTICFGITSLIVTASQEEYEYEQVFVQVGADIRIQVSDEVKLEFKHTLTNFSEDITQIAEAERYSGYILGDTAHRINVVGINSSEYLSISQIKNDYAPNGNAKQLLTELASNPNGVLISEQWAEDRGFQLGDPLFTTFSLPSGDILSIRFEIFGFLEILPGVAILNNNLNPSIVTSQSVLKEANLTSQLDASYTFLLDIQENPKVNATEIGRNLSNTYLSEIQNVRVFEEYYAQIQERQGAFVSALDFMTFQFPFLLIIATLGILVVTYLSVIEKRREFALMRVRGTLKPSLLQIQLGEGIVIIILGFAIGLIGFLIGGIMNKQLDSLDPFTQLTGITRDYQLPIGLLVLQFSITFIIFILTIFLTTFSETKQSDVGKVVDILRNY